MEILSKSQPHNELAFTSENWITAFLCQTTSKVLLTTFILTTGILKVVIHYQKFDKSLVIVHIFDEGF